MKGQKQSSQAESLGGGDEIHKKLLPGKDNRNSQSIYRAKKGREKTGNIRSRSDWEIDVDPADEDKTSTNFRS